MTITIGGHTLATRRPADLDERLVSATGLSAKETGDGLRAGGFPAHVARALHPFLAEKDAPSVDELAHMIEGGDVIDVRRQVVALYDAADEKAAGQ